MPPFMLKINALLCRSNKSLVELPNAEPVEALTKINVLKKMHKIVLTQLIFVGLLRSNLTGHCSFTNLNVLTQQ